MPLTWNFFFSIHRWSYVSSAALKIGQDVLEISNTEFPHFVNGLESPILPTLFACFGLMEKRNKNHTTVKINFKKIGTISFHVFETIVGVSIDGAREEDFNDAVGLMGLFATGALLGRDGATVFKDVHLFGLDWQVIDTKTMLFHEK